MRIRLASAALSLMVMMLVAPGVQGQFPAPTAQFPLWGTCFETSPSGLAAMTAFQSAVPVVLGDPAQVTCNNLRKWRNVMPGERTEGATGAKSITNPLGLALPGEKAWPDGVTFSTAVAFLKTQLAYENAPEKAMAIKNAYLEVYGRSATPTESYGWSTQVMAQKAWYATIAFAEIKKLNANQSERRSMVNHAYEASMGRNATVDERGYWVPRTEHYRLIVDATRTWLYSPSGVNELVQTVTRAQTVKLGKAATEANIKTAIAAYSANKSIYSEMIKDK